jgi:hypothetical protein
MIPSSAQAYSFNLTVVPHAGGAVDYVTLWAAGATQPYVATVNDPQGAIISNAAIVPAGTPSGGISVYNQGPATTDVIIDMNGYFAPTFQPFGVDAENLSVTYCNHNVGCPLIDEAAAAGAQYMRLFALWYFMEPEENTYAWGEYPWRVWYAQQQGNLHV